MVAADYDYYADRSSIILRALRMVGGLHEGEVLSAYQDAAAQAALNTLVKSWQTKGIFLWTENRILVSTVAGTDNYVIPSNSSGSPLISIDKAFIRDNGQDIPLEVKSWRDFQDIFKKAEEGFPQYISHDAANGLFYLWQVPDAIYSLYVFGVAKLKDFESSGGSGDVPSRWDRALVFGLAKELSFEYPMPANERDAISAEAEIAFLDGRKTEKQSSSDVQQTASCFPRSY